MADKQIRNLKVHSTETFCPHLSDMSSFLWQKYVRWYLIASSSSSLLLYHVISRLSLHFATWQLEWIPTSWTVLLQKIRNVLQRFHLKMSFLALLIIYLFWNLRCKYIEILTSKIQTTPLLIFLHLWNLIVPS